MYLASSILIYRYSYWALQSLPYDLYYWLILFSIFFYSSTFYNDLWNCPTLIKAELQMLSTILLKSSFKSCLLYLFVRALWGSNFWSQGKMILSILVFYSNSDTQLARRRLWIFISPSRKLLYFLSSSAIVKTFY